MACMSCAERRKNLGQMAQAVLNGNFAAIRAPAQQFTQSSQRDIGQAARAIQAKLNASVGRIR